MDIDMEIVIRFHKLEWFSLEYVFYIKHLSCFHYSILDIKGEPSQRKWDCRTDEFIAVWWDCYNWQMVCLSFFTFIFVKYCTAIPYFLSNRMCFSCDRSDDTDVARTPFSLPLSLTRRWSATQSVNPSHFPSFSPGLWTRVSFFPRYNIPFQAATHHAVSPFCCILPPSSDLLSLPPARQALQFAWNVAWHSGIDKLLDVLCGASADVPE